MTLTPSERRGALVLLAIFAIGAARDLWETRRGHPMRVTAATAPGSAAEVPEAPPVSPATVPVAAVRSEVGDRAGESAQRRLDLNRASVTDLDALPGIGPVLAGRIVEYRRAHGPFRSVDELLAVRGLGPKSFGRLRDRVTVEGSAGAAIGP